LPEPSQQDAAEPVYVVTCIYGLERVLAHEVKELFGVEAERHWCEVAFPYGGNPADLARLRVAGNVFVRFARFPISADAGALDEIRRRLGDVPVDSWREMWARPQEAAPEGISVSVSRKGEHAFTYTQVEEAAIEVLASRAEGRVTLDPAPLELRIDIDGEWCRFLGRLTARPLSIRDYRKAHMRGATEPSLAAAVVELSSPRPDDVFLDPFCGIGTIAIERALLMPAALVLAADLRPKRIEWARTNADAAGVDLATACWDSGRMPLRDRAVTRVVTSPPQSDPETGKPWSPEPVAGLLAESLRVLAYDGILVWLLQHGPLFDEALKLTGVRWKPRHMQCSWNGRPWVIHTLHKTL
jgi:23S rRNA G2445 N2-methylase RlmL